MILHTSSSTAVQHSILDWGQGDGNVLEYKKVHINFETVRLIKIN